MKQVYAGIPIGVLIVVLLAIFAINGFATYFGNTLIPNITKLTSIIILLTVYFMVHNRMANIFMVIFLFSLIGDAFYVFNFGEISNKLATLFYLGSYCLLIFVLLGKFKCIKYEGLVTLYLIVVLLLNSYFLFALYGAIRENFTDTADLVLSVSHGITLIAMTFFAFAVYLSKETNQSIIFLIMVFCFVFSDVLMYICNLYVYFWVFEYISNMLHLISLVLLIAYVYNHHVITNKNVNKSYLDYRIPNSERLTI